MTDLDELSFSTGLDGGDSSNQPPASTPGILVTLDHVLQSIPNVVDAWRHPQVPKFQGPPAAAGTTASADTTLLMIGLLVGLVWLVK